MNKQTATLSYFGRIISLKQNNEKLYFFKIVIKRQNRF